MALFKATWFMRYQTFGYSFSLYKTVATIQNMLTPAKDLRSVFGQLLAPDVEIPYFRVSDEGVKRDSLYQDEPAIVIGGVIPGPQHDGWAQIKAAVQDQPDFGGVAVLIDLIVSSVAKGRIFFRLIPDNLVIYPGGFNADPMWMKAFDRFAKLLKSDAWQIRVTASTAVNPQLPIMLLQFEPILQKLTVTTFNAHNLTVGETVRIGQTVGSQGVNGTYIVIDTPTNGSFVVQLQTVPTLGTQPSGYARRMIPDFQVIETAKVKGITSRKPGRPFGVSVGRRPA